MESIKFISKERNNIDFYDGIEVVSNLILSQADYGCKLMFIGNGASAAISSHMSTDYWKNGGMRAIAFNDSSLLTCISNDYGYPYVFEKPIEMFADPGDILMAISSSGKSENIINGVKAARSKKCGVITFSGFSPDNPLVKSGDYNFHVSSPDYGPVEIIHLSICHCICDLIIQEKSQIK
jgi:D-sedoheptulose 7-phosphate isomerase